MNDKQSAAIILGMFTVAFILWYRKQGEEKRTALFGGGGAVATGVSPSAEQAQMMKRGGVPTLPTSAGYYNADRDLLLAFAERHGLRRTDKDKENLQKKGHVKGSLHYSGRAIDVSSRGMTDAVVSELREFAARAGIKLRDERRKPAGQGAWTAPHIHLEVPK